MPNDIYIKQITPQTRGLQLPSFVHESAKRNRKDYIQLLRYLPDLVMQHHGIVIGTSESEDWGIIQPARTMYCNTADWLQFYWLDGSVPRGDKLHYKPLAEMALAALKLAQEVLAFCQWEGRETLSPLQWWFACEWELCEEILQNSGYTSNKPVLTGGSKYYSEMVGRDKLLNTGKVELKEIAASEATPLELLEGLSWLISQHEGNFMFRQNHYRVYCSAIKRYARQLRDSPLNPVYLVDGRVHRMERGKGQSPKKIMK